jgi:hypothetical protein
MVWIGPLLFRQLTTKLKKIHFRGLSLFYESRPTMMFRPMSIYLFSPIGIKQTAERPPFLNFTLTIVLYSKHLQGWYLDTEKTKPFISSGTKS